jgi:FkbM family methyltransferase
MYAEGDDFVSSQVFWKGYTGYEGASVLLFYHLSKRVKGIVDVGANVGYFTLIAAKANPAATVYAFEPGSEIFQRLQRNIRLNDLGNVRAECSAASDGDGTIAFYLPNVDTLPLAGSTKQGWAGDVRKVEVPAVTLDMYSKAQHAERIGLVKMYCEFHEPEVLRGMTRLLREDKPVLLMEVLFPGQKGITEHFHSDNHLQIAELMRANGYFFYRIGPHELRRVDQLKPNPDERNYLFSTKRSKHEILAYEEMDQLLDAIG